MNLPNWMEEFPGAITITDENGIILWMNRQAILTFEKEGGAELIGRNVFYCHRPESQEKIRRILETGQPNIYTVEKQGRKKLIYQTVWTENRKTRGLVEISLEIPRELPHFVRD
ncbi:MAG: PAS domain-containing protein [Candidatus Saccharicenans sp.]|nr:PAS domain-containing protein [Candidatus Saccharicenans sp.]